MGKSSLSLAGNGAPARNVIFGRNVCVFLANDQFGSFGRCGWVYSTFALWLNEPFGCPVNWKYFEFTPKLLWSIIPRNWRTSDHFLCLHSINSPNMDGLHVQQQYIFHGARHTHHQFHLTTHVPYSWLCDWNEVLKRDEHRILWMRKSR